MRFFTIVFFLWGAMSNSGYVQILHELLRHSSFISAPPAYRCVLLTIIDHACYAPCQQDDHGVLINLLPGQFLCSIRKLAELANVGRKDAEHAIDRFFKIGILGQEVRHTKTVFTILWGIKKQDSGTEFGTTLGQVRDIKENNKKKKQQQPLAAAAFSDSQEKKVSKKQVFINDVISKHPKEFDETFISSLIKRYSMKCVIPAMDEYENSSTTKTNPRGFLTTIIKTYHEKMNEYKLANK